MSHTSKPVKRLVQASVSPLLADGTFSITVPIRIVPPQWKHLAALPVEYPVPLDGQRSLVESVHLLLSKEATCLIPKPYRYPELYSAGARIEYGPHRQSPGGFSPPCVRRPRDHPQAPLKRPPEPLPSLGRSFGTAPRRRPWLWESKPPAATRWPSPSNPANLPMRIAGSSHGPDCNSII